MLPKADKSSRTTTNLKKPDSTSPEPQRVVHTGTESQSTDVTMSEVEVLDSTLLETQDSLDWEETQLDESYAIPSITSDVTV